MKRNRVCCICCTFARGRLGLDKESGGVVRNCRYSGNSCVVDKDKSSKAEEGEHVYGMMMVKAREVKCEMYEAEGGVSIRRRRRQRMRLLLRDYSFRVDHLLLCISTYIDR